MAISEEDSARDGCSFLGRVTVLRRYPVKSMCGEDLPVIEVSSQQGMAGDRTHAVIDQRSGKVASAKNPRLWRELLTMSASAPPTARSGDGGGPAAGITITLPNGAAISSSDPHVDQVLSDVLGRAVRLADQVPPGAELERAEPLEILIHGIDAEVPIVIASLDSQNQAQPASFVDYAPVHLMTTATLEQIAMLHPRGRVDLRRYRPNIVVQTSPDIVGFAENAWVGQQLQIGAELTVHIVVATPRCAIPTLAYRDTSGDLPRDTSALRVLADHNRLPIPGMGEVACAGVYAQVLHPGTVRHGDTVRLLSAEA
jgi:uncharacterized protein YcbX